MKSKKFQVKTEHFLIEMPERVIILQERKKCILEDCMQSKHGMAENIPRGILKLNLVIQSQMSWHEISFEVTVLDIYVIKQNKIFICFTVQPQIYGGQKP